MEKMFQTTNQYVCIYIYIGKTSYFTELNQGQLAGDDAPNPNQHSTVMAMTISYNVGTWLVAWYSIVANFFLLIQ